MKKNGIIRQEFAGLEFVFIPAGKCVIGTEEGDPMAFGDEHPLHELMIDYDYWCGRYHVTNKQFEAFVEATGFITNAEKEGWAFVFNVPKSEWEKVKGASWRHPLGPDSTYKDFLKHPVISVCFYDVLAYFEWLNKQFGGELPKGYRFSLPNEVEWEKAARGERGVRFPWGDEFDPELCSYHDLSENVGTSPVGTYSPKGDSCFGAADMAGNVWDWTRTLWGEDKNTPEYTYPYVPGDGRENLDAGEQYYRIIRGGSFKNIEEALRSACRDLDPPKYSLNNLGFRVFVLPAGN